MNKTDITHPYVMVDREDGSIKLLMQLVADDDMDELIAYSLIREGQVEILSTEEEE